MGLTPGRNGSKWSPVTFTRESVIKFEGCVMPVVTIASEMWGDLITDQPPMHLKYDKHSTGILRPGIKIVNGPRFN